MNSSDDAQYRLRIAVGFCEEAEHVSENCLHFDPPLPTRRGRVCTMRDA